MRPRLTDGTEEKWSVFVGGSEVTPFYDFDTALAVAYEYLEEDYNDILLMQDDTGETINV